MAVLVEGEVGDAEDRLAVIGCRVPGAADDRAQTCDDLFEAEGLGDVVVSAGGEAGDAVADGILRGEEQHRHKAARFAQTAKHGHAVEVGHHDVEHESVRLELACDLKGLEARGCGAHLPPFHPQRHREQVGEHLLVVDGEDAQGRAVGAAKFGEIGAHESILRNHLWGFYGARYASPVRSALHRFFITRPSISQKSAP